MKKLFKIFIPIIIILALMLVGCGNSDSKNSISQETTTETESIEEPTEIEADESQEDDSIEGKEEMYKDIVSDVLSMDLNSQNLVATISKQNANVLEVEKSASGDSKNVILVGDVAKYIVYNIGKDSYLEIHVQEHKDDDGEIKEAEDLYYKITNNKISGNSSIFDKNGIEDFTDLLQISSENVSSVEYGGKQNIHGMDCKVVEIGHRIEQDGEVINNKSFFYFTTFDTMFGCKFSTSTNTIDFYFPDSLKIELPKDVEFVEVDDSVINAKIATLYSSGLLNIKLS